MLSLSVQIQASTHQVEEEKRGKGFLKHYPGGTKQSASLAASHLIRAWVWGPSRYFSKALKPSIFVCICTAPLDAPGNFILNRKTCSQPSAVPISEPAYISIVGFMGWSTSYGNKCKEMPTAPLSSWNKKAWWPGLAGGHCLSHPFVCILESFATWVLS